MGQNHQGDFDIAMQYIEIFSREGADAIKFQTRNNKYLFAEEAYSALYTSENAFASTYGAHREKLELKPEWLPLLKAECEKHGVKFMSTPFDEISLQLLIDNGVDLLKIASFDLGNLPLIQKIAVSGKPTVLSIGGGNPQQVRESILQIRMHNSDFAVLHCVSEYPCEYDKLGLENIKTLLKEYPDVTIGVSDHFNGTLSGPVAFMQGARVFEKHVTLNRAWKGTDHSFALEPEGFRKFVRDIKRVPYMLPSKSEDEIGKEPVFQKLGKSLVASRNISAGEKFTLENLSGKIFNKQYIPVRESYRVLGLQSSKDLAAGEPLSYEFILKNE